MLSQVSNVRDPFAAPPDRAVGGAGCDGCCGPHTGACECCPPRPLPSPIAATAAAAAAAAAAAGNVESGTGADALWPVGNGKVPYNNSGSSGGRTGSGSGSDAECARFARQFRALIAKRALCFARDVRAWVFLYAVRSLASSAHCRTYVTTHATTPTHYRHRHCSA